MKIVHICLSSAYIEGWGYQENLLPEYLYEAGTENHIISSNCIFPAYLSQDIKNQIIAKGLKYKVGNIYIHKICGKRISSSVLIPYGLKKMLDDIKPDVIFHHGISITTLPIVSKYAKKHNCKLFVDNHADEINMSKNKLWILFYYKFLSRLACSIRRSTFTKFYGVTNSRCDFINKYFGVTNNKIELLPIGADTNLADTLISKKELRDKYKFSQDEKIVVSGGKMGIDKGTFDLIRAIEELKATHKIKLILFGKFEDEETKNLAQSKDFVTIYGWCDRIKTLELLKLADVACWPIHHTTLNEDAIAVGTPLIIRKTGTTQHLINGNGIWLESGNKKDLKNAIEIFYTNKGGLSNEIHLSCKKMKEKLSYNNIAHTIIQTINKK